MGRTTIPQDGLAHTQYVNSEILGDGAMVEHDRKYDGSNGAHKQGIPSRIDEWGVRSEERFNNLPRLRNPRIP